MKGVEHGVLSWNFTFVKCFFSKSHGFCHVLVVLLSTKKTATAFRFWMRSLDLNASHSTFVSPQPLDRGIVKKGFETEEAQIHQFVMGPFLNPCWFSFQVRGRDGYGSVVVNHQLIVGRNADVEFNAVKHLQGMQEAIEGVFRRRSPRLLPCHGFSSHRSSSKVPAEEVLNCKMRP